MHNQIVILSQVKGLTDTDRAFDKEMLHWSWSRKVDILHRYSLNESKR